MKPSIALLCLSLAACAGNHPSDGEELPESPTPEPASVDGAALAAVWRPETILLPDDFAPGLPKGTEKLLFAPGMFEAGVEDSWSYVFVIEFEHTLAGHAALLDVLEQYYVGLIESVAESRELTLERDAARVELKELSEGHYAAEVDLVDAFVTGEPLLLHMDLTLEGSDGGTILSAAASPQPREHGLWPQLFAVRRWLREDF